MSYSRPSLPQLEKDLVETEFFGDHELFEARQDLYQHIRQLLCSKGSRIEDIMFNIPSLADENICKLRGIRPDIAMLKISGDFSQALKGCKMFDEFNRRKVKCLELAHLSVNGNAKSSFILRKIYCLNPSSLNRISLEGFKFTSKEFAKLLLIALNSSLLQFKKCSFDIDNIKISSNIKFKLGGLVLKDCRTYGSSKGNIDIAKLFSFLKSNTLGTNLKYLQISPPEEPFTEECSLIKALHSGKPISELGSNEKSKEYKKSFVGAEISEEDKRKISRCQKCIIQ
ncbi:unnamed protein product [Moneuplotes crassus]|uniref:Uncharacterized protein n=1 Tax=Euplotes crassus TaxID=5936 RepID=A0AAD1XT77_EUPCR|nr:unnamed protein product [Moneuplotes crassus]